jgi:Zn-dependent peptidase ImmA (M78 family)
VAFKNPMRVKKQAVELLRDHNLLRAPVDVDHLARALGAEVFYEEMEDKVSGLLLYEESSAKIAVNKDHHRNRQRFTVAHEIAHLVLHASRKKELWIDHEYYFRSNDPRSGDEKAEVEANRFAADLLMPKELIVESIDSSLPLSDLGVARLALRFGVSEQAMMWRLVNLGLIGK